MDRLLEPLKLKMEDEQMLRNISSFTKRLLFLGIGIILFASPAAFGQDRDIDIIAKTNISGIVNGSPLEANVVTRLNTGRAGSATCTFTKLPDGLNPASLGTHL